MRALQQASNCCLTHHRYARSTTSAHVSFPYRSRLCASFSDRRRRLNHSQPRNCAAESSTGVRSEGSTENSDSLKEEKREPTQKLDKEMSRFATKAATTFAPRASGASKNPAFKGSLLYTIFEVQAWLFLVIGGLLSFNIIFPSEEPNIARLLGMWSIWMFTIPALRARDCSAAEKEALNYLFLLVPILNVSLPFVWKSFPFIYSADVVALAALYAWKVGTPFGEKETS